MSDVFLGGPKLPTEDLQTKASGIGKGHKLGQDRSNHGGYLGCRRGSFRQIPISFTTGGQPGIGFVLKQPLGFGGRGAKSLPLLRK